MTVPAGQLLTRARGLGAGLVALWSLALCGLGGCSKETAAPATQAAAQPVTVVAAPRPTGALPAGASCVTAECHAKYQAAGRVHAPVGAGSCNSCHLPDAGNHTYPLARAGNATCTYCHQVAGTKAHQHKAILDAPAPVVAASDSGAAPRAPATGCVSCHDPHASKVKFLLVTDTVDALCAKCHSVPLKKHAHEPFAAGQCTVCHQAHQSEFAGLLRNGSGPDHCYSCHTDKKLAMSTSSHVHKASAENCSSCHGPHATDFPKQLHKPVNDGCLTCHTALAGTLARAKVVHGATTQGCNTCHEPHASNQPHELKARMDKVCLSCHEKAIPGRDGKTIAGMGKVLASKNLHGPVKSGSCSECHQPHAADQRDLLKKDFPQTFYAKFEEGNYALCFSCHDKHLVLAPKTAGLTGFRDGEKNLHFVHVNREEKGRTCKTCHDVHGSDLPKHMAATVPFEGSKWAMDMNYEPAESGGSCTPGCHKQQTYTRSTPAGGKPK